MILSLAFREPPPSWYDPLGLWHQGQGGTRSGWAIGAGLRGFFGGGVSPSSCRRLNTQVWSWEDPGPEGKFVYLSVAFWSPFPQARPAEGEVTPCLCTAPARSESFPHVLPALSFTITLGIEDHRPLFTGEETYKLVSFPRSPVVEGRVGARPSLYI